MTPGRTGPVQLGQEFLDLLSLYPQPVRRQAAVEYLTEPSRVEGNR